MTLVPRQSFRADRSLEEQLALRIEQKEALEAKAAAGEEIDAAELEKRKGQAERLTAQLGSSGVLFFRQIDADGSGKVDRAELLNALKILPRPEGSFKKVPLDDIVKTLDVRREEEAEEEAHHRKRNVDEGRKEGRKEGMNGRLAGLLLTSTNQRNNERCALLCG